MHPNLFIHSFIINLISKYHPVPLEPTPRRCWARVHHCNKDSKNWPITATSLDKLSPQSWKLYQNTFYEWAIYKIHLVNIHCSLSLILLPCQRYFLGSKMPLCTILIFKKLASTTCFCCSQSRQSVNHLVLASCECHLPARNTRTGVYSSSDQHLTLAESKQ